MSQTHKILDCKQWSFLLPLHFLAPITNLIGTNFPLFFSHPPTRSLVFTSLILPRSSFWTSLAAHLSTLHKRAFSTNWKAPSRDNSSSSCCHAACLLGWKWFHWNPFKFAINLITRCCIWCKEWAAAALNSSIDPVIFVEHMSSSSWRRSERA